MTYLVVTLTLYLLIGLLIFGLLNIADKQNKFETYTTENERFGAYLVVALLWPYTIVWGYLAGRLWGNK